MYKYFSLREKRFVLPGTGNKLDEPYLFSEEGEDFILFPGLVNSHDHLDFNCFRALKSRTCSNYRQWGRAIQDDFREEIKNVIKVPFDTRYQWGLYRNLINGITTVVDHGNICSTEYDLIEIFKNKQDLHSVGFEKNWKRKLNNPAHFKVPVVIHAGEGTDKIASREISSLLKWNLVKRRIVGIHGVGMNSRQARSFTALVWCPSSNEFLFNSQPPIGNLKSETTILFGTDSTLTGQWSIWDHLRLARSTGLLSDKELFDTVTSNAKRIWVDKKDAINAEDFVLAKRQRGKDRWDAFFSIKAADILLVMHKGEIKLIDHGLINNLPADLAGYETIMIDNSVKHIPKGIVTLSESIQAYYPAYKFPFQVSKTPKSVSIC